MNVGDRVCALAGKSFSGGGLRSAGIQNQLRTSFSSERHFEPIVVWSASNGRRVRRGPMDNWLHNLPLPWMAFVVFAATYLITAAICVVVMVLGSPGRARAFKAISPGMLP